MRVHRFERLVNFGQLGQSAVDQGTGFAVSLANIGAYAEFTALFNQYRICQVDLEYILSTQVIGSSYPRMAFCVDYNDSAAPATEADLLQYEHCSVINFSQFKTVFKRSFKPRIALAAYQPSAFSSYSTAPPDSWVDTDNPTVQHYGWKTFITNYNSTSFPAVKLQLYFRFHFECKGLR
jgi:hypothetical protein